MPTEAAIWLASGAGRQLGGAEIGGHVDQPKSARGCSGRSRDLRAKPTQPESTMAKQLSLDIDRPAVDLREPLLTAAAAAGMLAVRTSWIYEAARRGHLPCVRVGKHVRFLRSDLECWVAEQRARS
jgi:excisionase family DNA binding protein